MALPLKRPQGDVVGGRPKPEISSFSPSLGLLNLLRNKRKEKEKPEFKEILGFGRNARSQWPHLLAPLLPDWPGRNGQRFPPATVSSAPSAATRRARLADGNKEQHNSSKCGDG